MNVPCRALFGRIVLALSVALAGIFLAGSTAAGDETPAPFALPPYLKGIDLNQPAQAAFAGWPPKELEDRP